MKTLNFKKEKMKFLTKEQQESCEIAKICCICKHKFENIYLIDKKYSKVRDYLYTGDYRGSNYDYHFIIEELAEEFKKQFTCL